MTKNVWTIAILALLLSVGRASAQDAAPAPAEVKLVRFSPAVEVKDLESGTLTVLKPGEKKAIFALPYKAYPYGSKFESSADARFKIYFSDSTYAVIKGVANFSAKQENEYRKIVLDIARGDVNLSVEQRAQADQFSILTPLGIFSSLRGMSKLHVGAIGKGVVGENDFSFRTLSGSAIFNGLHFAMQGMVQANAFSANNGVGMQSSAVVGKIGEVKMELPSGAGKTANFDLTPGATVKITRAKAKGSNNWVVSVLTLYANGQAKNYFCYVENRGEGFATGDIIGDMLPEEAPESTEEKPAETSGATPAADDAQMDDFDDGDTLL
ncbi:MAG: hypothetical protein RR982_06440 [Kiritimatiellia bacterium]